MIKKSFGFSSWIIDQALLVSFQCFLSILQILGFNEPLQGGSFWTLFLSIRKAFWNSEWSTALLTLSFHGSWCYFLLAPSITSLLFCHLLATKYMASQGQLKKTLFITTERQCLIRKLQLQVLPLHLLFRSGRNSTGPPTPALSGRSPTAQTSMASSVKSSLADSWGLL